MPPIHVQLLVRLQSVYRQSTTEKVNCQHYQKTTVTVHMDNCDITRCTSDRDDPEELVAEPNRRRLA